MNYTNEQIVIQELRQQLKGQAFLPDNDGYEQARAVWNGGVKHKPAIIILPETVEDVQVAVRFANSSQLPLSVRGGGHDWAGRSLNDGGVVINLQKLKNISIHPAEKIAVVQGGITSIELLEAAEVYDLVAVTGAVGSVGFAGLTLGGGYGPLSPSYGLACDNLLSAEVVLSDGTLVTASETENPDLFWGLRGGGGNFGVVTTLTVRLHAAKPLIAGIIIFPWTEAEAIFKGYTEIMASAPDELAMFGGMVPTPDGTPAVSLIPVWNGDPTEGEKQIASIQQLGNPLMVQVGPMKCSDFVKLFDSTMPNGFHYELQTRWIPSLHPDAVSLMAKSIKEKPSPLSFISIHHFHGAPARVPLADAAFGNRTPHFMLELNAAWDPKAPEDNVSNEQWVRGLSASLAELSISGGYANLLGPNEHTQIAHAYSDNLSRLQQVKQKYDPTRLFNGISIPR